VKFTITVYTDDRNNVTIDISPSIPNIQHPTLKNIAAAMIKFLERGGYVNTFNDPAVSPTLKFPGA
jgi:hypothetical protein